MRTLNSICLVFDDIYKNPFLRPCHVHSSRVQRIINSKCHMTGKQQQQPLNLKWGERWDIKTCVFYSMSKQWPFFLSILWFSLAFIYYVISLPCTATLNHANTFHRTHHMCLILYHHFFNGNAESDRSGVLTPFIQYPIFCFRYLYMSQQNA